jgi:endonuclease YncB( thermonuclease family)
MKVYDGDSYTLLWKQDSRFVYANCRMYGIDTPEMRSPDESQKAKAQECKRMMTHVLMNERMLFTTVGNTGLDKYGRPLVQLFVDPEHTSQRCRDILAGEDSVNAWALKHLPGCMAYFGGSKQGEPGGGT